MPNSANRPASHTGGPAELLSDVPAAASERLARARAALQAASGDAPAEAQMQILTTEPPQGGARPTTQPQHGRAGSAPKPPQGSAGSKADEQDPYERARTICLNQLGYAARTRSQLQAVLGKRGIPDDVAADVLDRLTEVGLIDDAAYADAWVRSRHRAKGISRRLLGQELARAGIGAEEAVEALAQVDEESERKAAHALATKKARSLSGLEPAVAARRLAALLARKGYSPNLCFEIARQVIAEVGSVGITQESVND